MKGKSNHTDPSTMFKDWIQSGKNQNEFMNNLMLQAKAMENMFSFGQGFGNYMKFSAFKTTIGSNGRISIPEAERDATGINNGDLVQVIVFPIDKTKKII
ncbi:MAG: AbrB/MazE/SpoVT family DNA-binding domain-containing protein [Thaumarchaeota archaeon]|nr:AbrB/MazE/SpoVT family DNA-binding domain-containing protein [Nitrososphaerota archaeon]